MRGLLGYPINDTELGPATRLFSSEMDIVGPSFQMIPAPDYVEKGESHADGSLKMAHL